MASLYDIALLDTDRKVHARRGTELKRGASITRNMIRTPNGLRVLTAC